MQFYFGINICTRCKGMENEPPNMNQMCVSSHTACKLLKKISFGKINWKK